jgi:uncharacterized membrane protein YcaP (DUF421 family)
MALLQYGVALAERRSRGFSKIVKATLRALLIDGAFDDDALARERVSCEEVKAAVRASGAGDLAEIAAVVLETDGSLGVIATEKAGVGSALDGVVRLDQRNAYS